MQNKKIAIINGPNLNLLGSREPNIYGDATFEDFLIYINNKFNNIEFDYFQSNIEGEIINQIQHISNQKFDGLLLNAGAYTHTSIAIADAISGTQIPCIEIHISNIFARETFRQTSYIASKCIGSISGLGLQSYELGIYYFLNKANISKHESF
jgi:3-dehydroquinate dehydratase-2